MVIFEEIKLFTSHTKRCIILLYGKGLLLIPNGQVHCIFIQESTTLSNQKAQCTVIPKGLLHCQKKRSIRLLYQVRQCHTKRSSTFNCSPYSHMEIAILIPKGSLQSYQTFNKICYIKWSTSVIANDPLNHTKGSTTLSCQKVHVIKRPTSHTKWFASLSFQKVCQIVIPNDRLLCHTKVHYTVIKQVIIEDQSQPSS